MWYGSPGSAGERTVPPRLPGARYAVSIISFAQASNCSRLSSLMVRAIATVTAPWAIFGSLPVSNGPVSSGMVTP